MSEEIFVPVYKTSKNRFSRSSSARVANPLGLFIAAPYDEASQSFGCSLKSVTARLCTEEIPKVCCGPLNLEKGVI
jgi:hypothetical protein